jgi:hypothetical protein
MHSVGRETFSVCLCLFLLAAARQAQASQSDPWLPGSWQFGAAIATGVPFLVMSELSVGATDHAAFGILGGTTPIVNGFGIRPRGAIPIDPATRLLLSAPVVYYPSKDTGPAWWLARPSLLLDGRLDESWHLAGGGGVVGVATNDAIFSDDEDGDVPTSPYGRRVRANRTSAWWTVNALASAAVSATSHVFADVTLVFDGHRLAGADWIGGPPFIVFLGITTTL